MPLQRRSNQFWQSLEEDAGKRSSQRVPPAVIDSASSPSYQSLALNSMGAHARTHAHTHTHTHTLTHTHTHTHTLLLIHLSHSVLCAQLQQNSCSRTALARALRAHIRWKSITNTDSFTLVYTPYKYLLFYITLVYTPYKY